MTESEEIAFLREIESMYSSNYAMYLDLKRANDLAARMGRNAIGAVLMTRASRSYDDLLRSHTGQLPVRPELFELAELNEKCARDSESKSPGCIWGMVAFIGVFFGLIGFLIPFPDHQREMASTMGTIGFVVAGISFVIQIIAFVVFWSVGSNAYVPYNQMCARLGISAAMRGNGKH